MSSTFRQETCSASGCESPAWARQMCRSHYGKDYRARNGLVKGAKPAFYEAINGICGVDWCREDAKIRGVCQRHYQSLSKWGMVISDDTVCEACGSVDRLCVDHDHDCCPGPKSCGKCVRGILCNGCNSALGYLKDDVSRVKMLCDYITKRRAG